MDYYGMYMEEFPKRLRKAIDETGIKYKHLNDAIGVTGKQCVQRYLRGEALPRSANLVPMARALGVTVNWLLCEDLVNED